MSTGRSAASARPPAHPPPSRSPSHPPDLPPVCPTPPANLHQFVLAPAIVGPFRAAAPDRTMRAFVAASATFAHLPARPTSRPLTGSSVGLRPTVAAWRLIDHRRTLCSCRHVSGWVSARVRVCGRTGGRAGGRAGVRTAGGRAGRRANLADVAGGRTWLIAGSPAGQRLMRAGVWMSIRGDPPRVCVVRNDGPRRFDLRL